jgi:hypothetical protein
MPSFANSLDTREDIPFLERKNFPETFEAHFALAIGLLFGLILCWEKLI